MSKPDNTQAELGEILGKLQEATIVTYAKETLDGVNYRSHHANRAKAKQAILAWHNKQIEEVLGRLESHAALTASNKVEVVALTDIKRERNKLKESK